MVGGENMPPLPLPAHLSLRLGRSSSMRTPLSRGNRLWRFRRRLWTALLVACSCLGWRLHHSSPGGGRRQSDLLRGARREFPLKPQRHANRTARGLGPLHCLRGGRQRYSAFDLESIDFVRHVESDMQSLPDHAKAWIVDANVLIRGRAGFPEEVVNEATNEKAVVLTTRNALLEIRSEDSRRVLGKLPFALHVVEPEEEFIERIKHFGRLTGDLASLSEVDVELLALHLQIQDARFGSSGIRTTPVVASSTKSLRRTDMPSQLPNWGSKSVFDMLSAEQMNATFLSEDCRKGHTIKAGEDADVDDLRSQIKRAFDYDLAQDSELKMSPGEVRKLTALLKTALSMEREDEIQETAERFSRAMEEIKEGGGSARGASEGTVDNSNSTITRPGPRRAASSCRRLSGRALSVVAGDLESEFWRVGECSPEYQFAQNVFGGEGTAGVKNNGRSGGNEKEESEETNQGTGSGTEGTNQGTGSGTEAGRHFVSEAENAYLKSLEISMQSPFEDVRGVPKEIGRADDGAQLLSSAKLEMESFAKRRERNRRRKERKRLVQRRNAIPTNNRSPVLAPASGREEALDPGSEAFQSHGTEESAECGINLDTKTRELGVETQYGTEIQEPRVLCSRNEHNLEATEAPDEGVYCDACKGVLSQGEIAMACSRCDFDICLDCHTGAKNASRTRKKAPGFEAQKVASLTEDFAMQNVILQLGLDCVAPNGLRIKSLQVYGFKCICCNFMGQTVPDPMFCPFCGSTASIWRVPMQVQSDGVLQCPSNFMKIGTLAVSQRQVLGLAASSIRKLGLKGVPRNKAYIPIACLPASKGGRYDPGYVRSTKSAKMPSVRKDPRPRMSARTSSDFRKIAEDVEVTGGFRT